MILGILGRSRASHSSICKKNCYILEIDLEKALQYLSVCDIMNETGAVCASMSGSGSAVFGIFKSRDEAERCERAIRDRYPSAETFIEKPLN